VALVLDSTIMGEDANSYCTVAYADDYFDNHFNALKRTNWQALGDDAKSQVLIQACETIEQFRYTLPNQVTGGNAQGTLYWDSRQGRFTAYVNMDDSPMRYSVYQKLQFPRNRDLKSNGTIYIPPRIQMAQCEQAAYLISLDETAMANRLQGMNLDRIQIDKIQLTQEYAYQGVAIAPLAYEWLKPFLFFSSRVRRS
jgi:hypothetical protein